MGPHLQIASDAIAAAGSGDVGRILVWGGASRRRGGEAPKAPRGVGCGEGVFF